MSEYKVDMNPYFAQLESSGRRDVIKGRKADYSPKYYFEYNGAIYMKLKFEIAYIRNFDYPRVDVVKEINNRS